MSSTSTERMRNHRTENGFFFWLNREWVFFFFFGKTENGGIKDSLEHWSGENMQMSPCILKCL